MWHPPRESPWGTGAQLPWGWTLSLPDGQHPACTRIPGGARAAGCSQHCRFSSHGAGQEGFAAPQDRARSEAAPAPGGRRSSGHGQPEGHGRDHVSTLLWPPGWGRCPHSWDRHARWDSWRAPSPWLHSQQREEGGPGEAAGSELRGPATAGSGDRLRLPCAGRHARQPCPGRQGLKPHLFIAAAQLGPAASNHLLPLYSWPLVQLSTAAPPDRSGHSLHLDSSQQDLAGSLPASCPVPAAPCLQLSSPHGAPMRESLGRRLCPGGSPAQGSLPAWLEPWGELSSRSQLGPGGDASQMAHNTASSSAGWSPPGPGRVGMPRAIGIPCSSCCGKLATLGTTLSPAAGSPGRTPLQGSQQAAARAGASRAGGLLSRAPGAAEAGRQSTPPCRRQVLTSWDLPARGSVPILRVRAAAALLHPPAPAERLPWAGGITEARAGASLGTLAPGMVPLPREGTRCKKAAAAARGTGAPGGDRDPSQESLAGSEPW